MSLQFLNMCPDSLSGTRDEAARRPRPQKLAAELQIDDVVGAERFDEVGLDRDVTSTAQSRATCTASGRTPIISPFLCADGLRRHRTGEIEPLGRVHQEQLHPPAVGVVDGRAERSSLDCR